ncbi:uncharacterized protein LOC129001880 [Macrosteles quadrilineatus]|uniref:uncharacterized protein LOC129001880 n=1 Tax=Macrosteles quadrilineatus TaxID=74068 RepID=UPI0023E33576|nr:uncharacterized protein LOC129001880 [Macrosteles quadrilineatus]
MALLRKFCFFLPLWLGCYLFAVFQIASNLWRIHKCKEILDQLGPEENEDDENIEQRTRVLIINILRVVSDAVAIVVSIGVIYATIKKVSIVLKVAGVFVAILHSFQFIVYGLPYSGERWPWFYELLLLVILLYFAAVWYSYGEFIETNQQVTHPLGGGNENTTPMNQPEGGRNPGQGPSTIPSAPPLNTPLLPSNTQMPTPNQTSV